MAGIITYFMNQGNVLTFERQMARAWIYGPFTGHC